MLHNYPERKAFSPGRQTFAAIQAKQPDSPHDGWFFGLDGVENGLYGGVGVEKQGHIPHHGGVLGRRLRAGKRDRLHGLRLHLEEHGRLWQRVLLLPLRVQLADPSRRLAIDKNARRTARVKSRMRCRLEPHRERRYEILEIRLHVEEVDAARRGVPLLIQHGAIGGGADAHGLAHPGDRKRTVLRRRIAQVHTTDLEDADARHFARLVVADVRDEGTHERGAHHGLVAGDRIQQPDGILFTREIGLPAWLDKAEIDHFTVVRSGEPLAQLVQGSPRFRRRQHGGVNARRVRGDALEAVEARHFLDQVLLDGDVEAVGRRRDAKGVLSQLHGKCEPRECPLHFRRRNRDPQYLLRACDPHAHGFTLRQPRHFVDGGPRLAAAELEDQARRTLDAVDVVREIDAALEAVRGVAREVVAARASRHRLGIEERGLEEDVPRRRVRLGALAAHDAAQADHARVVGDAQHRLVDLDLLLVEQQDFFALAAPAYVDRAAQLVQVVDVQRPAELEHHVVRHVDERRDRALPRAFQTPAHPLRRRRRGADVADHASGEAPTALGSGQLHEVLRLVFCRDGFYLWCAQLCTGQRRYLAGYPKNGQAIGAVGRQLEREDVIVEPEHAAHVAADLRRFRQLEQAGVVVRQSKLARRAQHRSEERR